MARFNKPPLAVWLRSAAIKTAVCAVVWLLLALLMTGVTGQRFGRSDISLIVAACLLFAAIQTVDYATVAVRWTLVWGAGFVISMALKLMPQSPPAHYWLGRVLQAQGRAAEACQELQTVIDLVPHSAFAALAQIALQPPGETTTSGGAMPAYYTAPEIPARPNSETMPAPVPVDAAPLSPPTLEP